MISLLYLLLSLAVFKIPVLDITKPQANLHFFASWLLVALGVGFRIWAAGNLRKNQEITMSGIYAMLRHPMYTGTMLIYSGFFIAATNIVLTVVALLTLLAVVYYPRALHEEERLLNSFPQLAEEYSKIPRFIPDLRRLPRALRTNRFSLKRAYKNLGIRSLWAFILVPFSLKLLVFIQRRYLLHLRFIK